MIVHFENIGYQKCRAVKVMKMGFDPHDRLVARRKGSNDPWKVVKV